jgi:hypothetical protein
MDKKDTHGAFAPFFKRLPVTFVTSQKVRAFRLFPPFAKGD